MAGRGGAWRGVAGRRRDRPPDDIDPHEQAGSLSKGHHCGAGRAGPGRALLKSGEVRRGDWSIVVSWLFFGL